MTDIISVTLFDTCH